MLTALRSGESPKGQGFHLPGFALLVFMVMESFSSFPLSTRKNHFSTSLPWVSQGYKQVQLKWNWSVEDTKSSVSLPIWIMLLKNNYCWGCGISQLYQTHPQILLHCGLLNPEVHVCVKALGNINSQLQFIQMIFSEVSCLGKPKFITRGLANSLEMELITRISISKTFLLQALTTNIFP